MARARVYFGRGLGLLCKKIIKEFQVMLLPYTKPFSYLTVYNGYSVSDLLSPTADT